MFGTPQKPRRKPSPKPLPRPTGADPTPIAGKKPGVGYVSGPLSYAGRDHGFSPVPFDLTVSLIGLSGVEFINARARMAAGGNVLQANAGAPGVHPPEVEQILRRAWEFRDSSLLANPEDYNGIPNVDEITRAYYGQGDGRLAAFASTIFNRDNPTAPPEHKLDPVIESRLKTIEQRLADLEAVK